jgi:hypothetical protein
MATATRARMPCLLCAERRRAERHVESMSAQTKVSGTPGWRCGFSHHGTVTTCTNASHRAKIEGRGYSPRAVTPPPAPSPTPTGCYPMTHSGGCYQPGEYCRDTDHGASGVGGDGEPITCEYNNGWRWEASTTPAPTPAPTPTACYPTTNSGGCYEPGEYCRDSDHGTSGVAGDASRSLASTTTAGAGSRARHRSSATPDPTLARIRHRRRGSGRDN